VDNLEKSEILEKIEGFLAGDKLCQIATINPEFILEAQKNSEFKKILNNCDLNVADGIGIKFAYWKRGFQKLKCRMAGADFMDEILKIASVRGLGVFLVTNKEGLSTWEETGNAIQKNYPNIRIGGVNIACHSGLDPESKEILNQVQDDKSKIKDFDIVFVNFGAPFQEKFIYSLKKHDYGKIRVAMGVGGSFDFWTGKIKRAPNWMRKLGLEWLFRLILKPSRFKRIFRAVIIFPIKIILNK
jgi:N-acetylglucosaminyldiphosphoundecaprenol N-acetyl-beta-D-mannosaminyltransferase